jgi:hypothetical protein
MTLRRLHTRSINGLEEDWSQVKSALFLVLEGQQCPFSPQKKKS